MRIIRFNLAGLLQFDNPPGDNLPETVHFKPTVRPNLKKLVKIHKDRIILGLQGLPRQVPPETLVQTQLQFIELYSDISHHKFLFLEADISVCCASGRILTYLLHLHGSAL